VKFATPFSKDFFLKSSWRESRSLYKIASDNPKKIILQISFFIDKIVGIDIVDKNLFFSI
jgi:hypothetical protein